MNSKIIQRKGGSSKKKKKKNTKKKKLCKFKTNKQNKKTSAVEVKAGLRSHPGSDRRKRAGVKDMNLFLARFSSSIPQSLIDTSKIQNEGDGEKKVDSSSLHPLNTRLESSPCCVSGLQNIYRHKRIWVLRFFVFLSVSDETQLDRGRDGRYHSDSRPSGLFKACTLSSNSTLFLFSFATQRGGDQEAGRPGGGVECPTAGSAF